MATFEERSAAPADRFTATIDWGDGTPATSGTVTQVGRTGSYEVVARLSDGRTLRLATRGRRVRVPNADRSLSARVRVTGIGADGRRGPSATRRARAAGPRRARVRL